MRRRELFSFLSSSVKGEKRKKNIPIVRPPYFHNADAFDKECINCDGLCATSCQEHIIFIGEDKTPRIDFSSSGCTYCDDCAIACQSDVLQVKHKSFINLEVTINQKTCLSWQGIMCFSCKDPCLEDAIEFKAMFMPTIDLDKCTACGFCISRCPSLAINIKEKNEIID